MLKPPEVAEDDVTPPENVAVRVLATLRITTPEPPAAPAPPI
jgi:hypothetical protein